MQLLRGSAFVSHLVSITSIVIILGFKQEYYFVKMLFVSLCCLTAILVFIAVPVRKVNLFLFAFLIYVAVFLSFYRFFNSYLDANFIFKTLLPVCFGVCVYVLAPFLRLMVLIRYLAVYYAVAIVFVIGQFFHIDFFWGLHKSIFHNKFIDIVMNSGIPVGLSSSPFYMGSQLAIITPVLISHLFRDGVARYFFLFASFFTYQRGYILFLTLVLLRQGNLFNRFAGGNRFFLSAFGLMVLGGVVLVFFKMGVVLRAYDFERFALYLAATIAILDNPAGYHSFGNYQSYLEGIVNDYPILYLYSSSVIGFPPHNILQNISILYGVHTLVVVIVFGWLVLRKHSVFRLSVLGGLFISLFHNMNFMYADFFIWIFISLHIYFSRAKANTHRIYAE